MNKLSLIIPQHISQNMMFPEAIYTNLDYLKLMVLMYNLAQKQQLIQQTQQTKPIETQIKLHILIESYNKLCKTFIETLVIFINEFNKVSENIMESDSNNIKPIDIKLVPLIVFDIDIQNLSQEEETKLAKDIDVLLDKMNTNVKGILSILEQLNLIKFDIKSVDEITIEVLRKIKT